MSKTKKPSKKTASGKAKPPASKAKAKPGAAQQPLPRKTKAKPDAARQTRFPTVESKPDFTQIEQKILKFWEQNRVFEQSVTQREAGSNEYVFYDGPPFANGLPHYGHLLTGYVKDVVPRYHTMRGRRVERRFGWDCHGLPPEMEAEQELGLQGRQSIETYGVAEFNDYCRQSVMRYTAEWERYVGRQARWVDFHNDYKTMDLSYMESVIWAFKQLWDKGLIYEAYRVMPYSWGAQTPLSNFEIRLDDATRSRQDPAVTVTFRLEPQAGDPGPLNLLAWTTTPWTLPSNLALAVHPEMDYDIWECPALEPGQVANDSNGTSGSGNGGAGGGSDNGSAGNTEFFILASETAERTLKGIEPARHAGTIKGAELAGRSYQPMFDYFANAEAAFQVLSADFVTAAEGTGIVHMAPGFGEDDQVVCEAAGISVVVPVDDQGNFTSQVSDWAGQNVFEANRDIIAQLRQRGILWRHVTIEHNYPFCWRTDTPIIYRAMNSWYVKVTAIQERMVELNQQINWIPDHVRDGRFGNWIKGARDWSISRNRFWGAPLPVWRSDNPDFPRVDVYGSLAELEADFGVRLDDLHRPGIDALVRPNPDDPSGKSMMRRVPEVLDCWFESGSMPFAQVHYPFENKDWFDSHFPADFIVEYINQTRGWFYTLHVLGTALFDSPPFKNAIGHGIVLAADGAKLSKRLKNYPDPEEVFQAQGSDALRWYLMSSPVVRGGDLRISEDDLVAVTRLLLYPVWNAYSFFCLYANADEVEAAEDAGSEHVLDRYILAKTHQLVAEVTAALDAYDLPGSCACLAEFIDALNNWYIRRSRDRFWAPKEAATAASQRDKQAAYNTLYTVLLAFTKLLAPMLPLLSEEIYLGLVTGQTSPEALLGGAGENDDPGGSHDDPASSHDDPAPTSVHLADWPDPASLPADVELVAAMDLARQVCTDVLRLRENAKVPVRVPLGQLNIAGPTADTLGDYLGLLADEVNVKEISTSSQAPEHFTPKLLPDGKKLGPRLKGDMQAVIAAAKAGQWELNAAGQAELAGAVLEPDEFEIALTASEPSTAAGSDDSSSGDGEASPSQLAHAVLSDGQTVLSLDLAVTEELQREGYARHLVRVIQQGRRDLGLDISDRIELGLRLPDELLAAAQEHQDYLADQVLAVSVDYVEQASQEAEIENFKVGFEISRAAG